MKNEPPVTIPPRAIDSHKGTFGRLLILGGARGMAGSVAMSAMAALRSGVGLVTIGTPASSLDTVAAFHPAFMTLPFPDDGLGRWGGDSSQQLPLHLKGYDVIGCGPGMSTGDGARDVVRKLMDLQEFPRVIDADALNHLATLRSNMGHSKWELLLRGAGKIVLTPHPKEMERLSGFSPSDRPMQIQAARELSRQNETVWVLKGGPTVVIANGELWVNETGNPGMATAGSGDVLTGVICSLLGQGLNLSDAAKLGVWVHGRAGDFAADRHGHCGLIATDLIDYLPKAMALVLEQ